MLFLLITILQIYWKHKSDLGHYYLIVCKVMEFFEADFDFVLFIFSLLFYIYDLYSFPFIE